MLAEEGDGASLMQQERYLNSLLFWSGCLLAFIVAFPYIASGLLPLSGCRSVGGACGAVGAVLGMTVKPAGTILLSLLALRPIILRAMRLGMGMGWTIAVAVWLFGAQPFLVQIGNFGGANFGLGLIFYFLPLTFCLMAILATFLCFADEAVVACRERPVQLAWLIAIVASAHATILSASSILFGLLKVPVAGSYFAKPLMPLLSSLLQVGKVASLGLTTNWVAIFDLIVFASALAFIARANPEGGLRSSPGPSESTSDASRRPPSDVRRRHGAAAATGFGRRGTRIT